MLNLSAKLLCVFQLIKEFLSALVCKIISCIKSINYNHKIDEILIYRDRGIVILQTNADKKYLAISEIFLLEYTNRLTWRRVFVRPRTTHVLIH